MNLIEKKTGYFKSADGTQIYFEERGAGEPLILVYGIGCMINQWRHQIQFFSRTHRTICMDYRAHHKSQIPSDKNTLDIPHFALDLRELCRHLSIGSAHFVSHSFGSQVLLECHRQAPELIQSLVFVNGFASNPIRGMFGTDIATQTFQAVKSAYGLLPDTSKYLWRKVVNNPLSIQLSALAGGFNLNLTALKDIEIYARGVSTMDMDSFIRLFEKMMTYDGSDVFEKIQCPVLIIGGKQDSVTPEHYQEEMFQKIPHSQILMVPYGSHCTQLDMPDYVNLRIEKFLEFVASRGNDSPRPELRSP